MQYFTATQYVARPEQALSDAVVLFRDFIDPDDVELSTMISDDGRKVEDVVLRPSSVSKLVRELIAQFRKAGVGIKDWICNVNEFNLCRKSKIMPINELVVEFAQFIAKRWTDYGIWVAHAAIFVPALRLHPFTCVMALFSALGFMNGAFCALCDCKS